MQRRTGFSLLFLISTLAAAQGLPKFKPGFSVNAFALPGGPTFVHTGLILEAENEAQLAGVLAHEISHVALRHGTHQATKAAELQLVAGVLGASVGGKGLLGQLTQAGFAFGAGSVLLKYSRDAERQAYLLGTQIMAGARYNPIEMARFLEKLESQGGGRGPQFLSDHPNPGNRVKAVKDEIRYLPRASYTGDSGQFARMQERVHASSGRPSSRFNQVQGREFAFTTVARLEGLFYLVLIAPQSEVSATQSAFDRMLASVRFGP